MLRFLGVIKLNLPNYYPLIKAAEYLDKHVDDLIEDALNGKILIYLMLPALSAKFRNWYRNDKNEVEAINLSKNGKVIFLPLPIDYLKEAQYYKKQLLKNLDCSEPEWAGKLIAATPNWIWTKTAEYIDTTCMLITPISFEDMNLYVMVSDLIKFKNEQPELEIIKYSCKINLVF